MKCEHGNEIVVSIEPTPHWNDGIIQYTKKGKVAHHWLDLPPHYIKIRGCTECTFIQIKEV